MPLFVGVVDQETPACERVASADDAKHRAFDAFVNPNAQRVGANAAGSAGAAGWGVQGHLGSDASVCLSWQSLLMLRSYFRTPSSPHRLQMWALMTAFGRKAT